MVELSDLEEAGSALLLGDECGTGVDALAFDDAEASDVGADVADVNIMTKSKMQSRPRSLPG